MLKHQDRLKKLNDIVEKQNEQFMENKLELKQAQDNFQQARDSLD